MLDATFKYLGKTIVLITCIFHVACTANGNAVDELKVEEFLTYLLGQNEEVLVEKYADNSPSFSVDDKLNEEISNFLYEPRSENSQDKSVLQLTIGGRPLFKIVPQDHGVLTILFFNAGDEHNLEKLAFLQNEWMKRYFACEFEVVDGELHFYQNICFAETDGPFPPDFDI